MNTHASSTTIEADTETASVEIVDAELALDWLNTQQTNRPVSEPTVNTYYADMIGGHWTFNAEPIKFDTDGCLIDGQHRLLALARTIGSSTALKFLVVRGLPPESQLSMDQGRRRDAGQQLGMLGHRNGAFLAGVARMVISIEEGWLFRDNKRLRLSNNAVAEWVAAHPDEVGLLNTYYNDLRKIFVRPGVSGAIMIVLSRVNPTATPEFFDALISGANLSETSSILALRRRFETAKLARERLSDKDIIGFYIQAWNAWRADRPLKRVQRAKTDWAPEHFIPAR
ncbi:hypothetical protein [Nocardia transvalensis]|uniref:hypothetical protein n=1 Tax=Nocardia transvalensis TaxID=37333 RepID=UPI001895AC92|nr:hypothetical protein [Nocardia transvalensis]MBF6332319.1 hypothetical protein [Nocardia transvalensis]